MRRTILIEFEMFNEFIFMKTTLKTFLRIFLRTFKTVSRKSSINSESNIRSSKFSYTIIVVTRSIKSLTIVVPPSIYYVVSILETMPFN